MINKFYIKNRNLVFLFLSFIPILVLLLSYNGKLLGNDFWWHIKVGEWICDNKALPVNDMFSWYGIENNLEWCSQEWLSGVIFYLVFLGTGEIGVYLFCVLLAVFLLLSIIINNFKYIKNRLLFSLIFLLMIAVCFPCFMYGRPQIFSGILLYYEIRILYAFYKNPQSKIVFCIPIIAVLWSNLHGGTAVLSYLLCVLFLATAIKPFMGYRVINPRKNRRFFIILSVVTVMTVCGIFVNPYGSFVFMYPYENITDGYMQSVILEWFAPDIKVIAQLFVYFIPFILSFLFMVLSKKRVCFVDFVLFLLFIYMFLRSVRFAYFAYIVISVFIFKYFPKVNIKVGKIGTLLSAGMVCCLCGYTILSSIPKLLSNNIIKKVLDTSYCELIKSDNPNRLFNDYNYGEALIFNDIYVFVDAREDLYASNILEDSINLLSLQNTKKTSSVFEPEAVIEKYQFDAILIQSNRPLRAYLDSHRDKYEKVMSDKNTAYYHVLKYYSK